MQEGPQCRLGPGYVSEAADPGHGRVGAPRGHRCRHGNESTHGTDKRSWGRLLPVDVLVVDHPLAQSRLTAMRDARTDPPAFRAALHELTTMLVYEASRSFPVD